MQKDKIWKLAVLNGSIILVNIVLFSDALFHLDMSGDNALTMALGIMIIVMSTLLFFYGNYKLLFHHQAKVVIQYHEIKNLDECMQVLSDNVDVKTFSKHMHTMQSQIKRFRNKKESVERILLQKFSDTEMSYNNFKSVINKLEDVLYMNIKSMLNRISAFDEEEYQYIIQRGPASRHVDSKLEIYNEYIRYADDSVDNNEEILIKLDKLILEISKFHSFDDGEIKNMDAMKEIDSLIDNAKWYK